MKLSICCISYNHEKYIREAIDSFLEQIVDFDYEIIISDDSSTDNTKEILINYKNRYPKIIKPFYNEVNIGFSANFKKALSLCSGDYIAYCDGDDYWMSSSKVTSQINALEDNKKCSFCFHDVDIVDSDGNFLRKFSSGRIIEGLNSGILNSNFVVGAPLLASHAGSLCFPRHFLDLKFLYYLGNMTGGDFALTVMLASCGDAFYIKDSLSAYRKNTESISSSRCAYDKKILTEIFDVNTKIDEYYQGIFSKEIKSNTKGHVINNLFASLENSIDDNKIYKILPIIIAIIKNYKGSQYDIRDVFWLFRKIILRNSN